VENLPDIAPFQLRLDELDAQMAAPSFYTDPRRAADVTREQQRLASLVADWRAHAKTARELAEAHALLKNSAADSDLRELAAAEQPVLEARRASLHDSVLRAMLPPDPADSRNTVLELRAGTGGEEAALFAAELARAYQKFAESHGWRVEPTGSSLSERGGFREATFLVSGGNVFRELKFESGVHRVQRVPVTESSGRIHTSTVTVAVLPEAAEVDVKIDPADLDISVMRASGPGGQGVNTTDSAVRVVHRPTGLTVYCADGRSQQKNKASALAVLRARLLQRQEDAAHASYAAQRRGQIGTGDRSERIRTYNFPQSRVTDHRVGFTSHNLPQVLEGAFGDLIAALQRAEFEEKLAALTGQPAPVARRAKPDDD
jgi:peptide chain release factor 1